MGEEDDGLCRGLEDGVEFGEVGEIGIIMVLAPVEEGYEVFILLADGTVFELKGEAEEVYVGGQAFFVEVAERDGLVEFS